MVRAFALSLLTLLLPATVWACEAPNPCALGDRSYHLRVPDTWDGQSPLPVLLHFHGWARQGDLIVRHDRIATRIVSDRFLLLAPNGLGKTWDFWQAGSRDTPFARAVLKDAATRYPIDPDRIYISGYSWGANMAWRFVCEDGADIAALLAVSGALPGLVGCDTRPRNVRQVYGLDDTVLPYPFGPDGDTTYAVLPWRRMLGCATTGAELGTWAARPFLTFTRTAWACADAAEVVLDTHPGGHFIPHDWIAIQLEELEGAGQRPGVN